VKGRIPGRDEAPYDVTGLDLSGTILELGPGNGQLRPLVAAAGGAYIGVDKDPRARERVLDYELHPEALPILQFDGIYCRNSISTSWRSLPGLARALNARARGWIWLALWTGDSTEADVRRALRVFAELDILPDASYEAANQVLVRRSLV
jgi:SAM-dependent methyltransferase